MCIYIYVYVCIHACIYMKSFAPWRRPLHCGCPPPAGSLADCLGSDALELYFGHLGALPVAPGDRLGGLWHFLAVHVFGAVLEGLGP